jgi:hypothetical protein
MWRPALTRGEPRRTSLPALIRVEGSELVEISEDQLKSPLRRHGMEQGRDLNMDRQDGQDKEYFTRRREGANEEKL